MRYGSTAEIAATLLEEGTNSPADVFFAQDPGGLGAVAKAGLFAPLSDTVLSKVPEQFRSPEGLWVGISGRARVVTYNTAKLQPADLPADIYDFVDPQWKGRIGWVPSNGSFQAMVTAMRQSWGEDKTRQWLTRHRRQRASRVREQRWSRRRCRRWRSRRRLREPLLSVSLPGRTGRKLRRT